MDTTSNGGRLYVVATPIGNLEDISARAIRVLQAVSRIAAEDTRHSRRLLNHFDIATPMISCHEHNETARISEMLAWLEDGRDLALITDAGTPCISDPGYRLVRAVRDAGYTVATIPGPCAVTAALSISGLPTDRFAFHGFFPRKRKEAQKMLDTFRRWPLTHVIYESPNRLRATLQHIRTELPDAEVAVTRELTKAYEEVITGTPAEVQAHFDQAPPRGECVLLIHPAALPAPDQLDDEAIQLRVREAMEQAGLSQRDAIRAVAEEWSIPRNRVYAAATRPPCVK